MVQKREEKYQKLTSQPVVEHTDHSVCASASVVGDVKNPQISGFTRTSTEEYGKQARGTVCRASAKAKRTVYTRASTKEYSKKQADKQVCVPECMPNESTPALRRSARQRKPKRPRDMCKYMYRILPDKRRLYKQANMSLNMLAITAGVHSGYYSTIFYRRCLHSRLHYCKLNSILKK